MKLKFSGHINFVLTVTELSDGNIISGSLDWSTMNRFTVNFFSVYYIYELQANTFAACTANDRNI